MDPITYIGEDAEKVFMGKPEQVAKKIHNRFKV